MSSTTHDNTADQGPSNAGGYKFSLGLVEISALATLIGAQSAEQLALGARGAAGLPWAAMSTFGLIYTIRASIGAACTDGMREALGLRGEAIDDALGMETVVDPARLMAAGVERRPLKGIWMIHQDLGDASSVVSQTSLFKRLWVKSNTEAERVHSVYAPDKLVTTILNDIPMGKEKDKLQIYYFKHTPHRKAVDYAKRDNKRMLFSLGAALLKLCEMYTLWKLGAAYVWWISALPWLHSFVWSILLHLTGVSIDKVGFGTRDVVIGELPTALFSGGGAKIIVGLPGNVRRHDLWTIFWATGACLYTGVLVMLFIHLSATTLSTSAVYAWVSFQFAWLISRIAIHQLIPLVNDVHHNGVVIAQSWNTASVEVRMSTVRTMTGVSSQLVTAHPRGAAVYREDSIALDQISELLNLVSNRIVAELPNNVEHLAKSEIVGVVGDATYRGIGWIKGNLDFPDIYDCALVFLRMEGRVYAVPSVRVLMGIPAGDDESRIATARYDPRGTANNGEDIIWIYWIPVGSGVPGEGPIWAEYRGRNVLRGKSTSVNLLGKMELHKLLQGGSLNISFGAESEILRTLGISRIAADILLTSFADSGLLVR